MQLVKHNYNAPKYIDNLTTYCFPRFSDSGALVIRTNDIRHLKGTMQGITKKDKRKRKDKEIMREKKKTYI
jgi:hypothetical protein